MLIEVTYNNQSVFFFRRSDAKVQIKNKIQEYSQDYFLLIKFKNEGLMKDLRKILW